MGAHAVILIHGKWAKERQPYLPIKFIELTGWFIKSTCWSRFTSDQGNCCFLIPLLAVSHHKHKTDVSFTRVRLSQGGMNNHWLWAFLLLLWWWIRVNKKISQCLGGVGERINFAKLYRLIESQKNQANWISCVDISWFRVFDLRLASSAISKGKG